MSEIRENIEFEADVLKEQGVDFSEFPRFAESMEKMVHVVAVRQALDQAFADQRFVCADGTVELLTSMLGNRFKRDVNFLMRYVGSDVLHSKVGKRALTIATPGAAVLMGYDIVEIRPLFLIFLVLTLITLASSLKVQARLEKLPDVERVVVRFYKEFEKVVESNGEEGFLSSFETLKLMMIEIEAGLEQTARDREHVPSKGSEYERIKGIKIFDALKDEMLLKKLLDESKPTVARTDSILQSLQSDSDSQ